MRWFILKVKNQWKVCIWLAANIKPNGIQNEEKASLENDNQNEINNQF